MTGTLKNVNWLSLQQPMIMLASLLSGKPVQEILAMEVHERLKLIDQVVGELKDVTAAGAAATDPAGPGGVTMTEAEWTTIVDESDDIGTAVRRALDYRTGAAPTDPAVTG